MARRMVTPSYLKIGDVILGLSQISSMLLKEQPY